MGNIDVYGKEEAQPEGESSFNYETTRVLSLEVYTGYSPVEVVFSRDDTVHYRALSGEDGWIRGTITVPDYYDTLVLTTDFIGLLPRAVVAIEGNRLTFDYSDPSLVEEGTAAEELTEVTGKASLSGSELSSSYAVLGSWNIHGRPDYLMERDSISSELLAAINEALPELKPVPEYNPHYLTDQVQTDLALV
ncbi:MAG: hypothetical protein PQJ60_04485, partial [Spirochaetales bacterium]|nr:hypothetical protein [Spirochaetales bacterium]